MDNSMTPFGRHRASINRYPPAKSTIPNSRLKSLLSQRTDLALTDQELTINQTPQTYQESRSNTRSA